MVSPDRPDRSPGRSEAAQLSASHLPESNGPSGADQTGAPVPPRSFLHALRSRASSHRRISRDVFWVSFGQFATLAAALVGLRLVTSLVSSDAYGRVILVTGLTALTKTLLCAPVLQAVLRFHADAEVKNQLADFRAAASRILRTGVTAGVLVLCLGGVIASLFAGPGIVWLVGIGSAGFALDVATSYETSLLNACRRQARASAWMAADAWARWMFAAGACLLAPSGAVSILSGFTLGSLAVYTGFRLFDMSPSNRRPDPASATEGAPVAWGSELKRFARPLVPLAFLNWVFNLGDRFVLGAVGGAQAAGIYASGYGLASQPFLALTGVMASALRPVLFSAIAAGDERKARRIEMWQMAGLIAGAVTGVVFLIFLADRVAALALGPEFRDASRVIPWIAGAYAILAIQSGFELVLYSRRRTDLFVPLHVVAGACALLFYAVFIPGWGAVGAGMATCAAAAVSCATAAGLARYARAGWSSADPAGETRTPAGPPL